MSPWPSLSPLLLPGPDEKAAGPEPPILPEYRRADAGHPSLPLGHALSPASDPDPTQLGRVRPAIGSSRSPGEQDLPRRSSRERHDSTNGYGVPKTGHPLHSGYAHSLLTLPYVELRALPTLIPQSLKHRTRPLHETYPSSPVPPP